MDVYFDQIRDQIRALEELEYRDVGRTKIIPAHSVLIDHRNVAQQDEVIKRDRRQKLKNRGYVATIGSRSGSGNNPGIRGRITPARTNLFSQNDDQNIFTKPWSKLDIEYQVNRLFVFINRVAKQESLADEQANQLRKLLLNGLFRKLLTPQVVDYDSHNGIITNIKVLKRQDDDAHSFYLENAVRQRQFNYLIGVSKIVQEKQGSQGLEVVCKEFKDVPNEAPKVVTPNVEEPKVVTPNVLVPTPKTKVRKKIVVVKRQRKLSSAK